MISKTKKGAILPLFLWRCKLKAQQLILIRGVPGSGKTKIAMELMKLLGEDAVHIESDHYFLNKNGAYRYNKALFNDAHFWCQRNARESLRHGWTVVVANPFIRVKDMQPYFDMAIELRIQYRVIEATGMYRNVHHIPDDVVSKMRQQFERYESVA